MTLVTAAAAQLSDRQRRRVDELLDEVLDLPEEQWLRGLQQRSGEDPAVMAEVGSLLRAMLASGDFLSSPATPAVAPSEPEGPIGIELEGWRITRLIGHGGMGDVYEAVRAQGDFSQRVAIKLLKADSGAQLHRFQSERRILASLEHAGIARLYDGGVTRDGRPFMVMEYVEGRSIQQYCTATHATLAQRLELFGQVCEAVAYAHRNLVVHRDLKPSNILVTADGRVKLLDFGIAKLLDAQRTQLTLAAAAPLSPVCAAPEQLTGGPITTATDVYALGLLLFEMLTGAHPWIRTDTAMLQALRTILQQPAPTASRTAQHNPAAPVPPALLRGDLDAIIAKALRTEPTHRYGTVEALGLDIARARRGEAVEAREGARLYVALRTLRRFRWAAAAILAIVLSLGGGLGLAAYQAHRAALERDIARRDAAREEAVRDSLTRLFGGALADHGSQPASAKTMIDSSAQRVLHEYRDQPQLEGQLVLSLADLYSALQDVTGAAALLDGFVTQARPDADPVALADARQKLAGIELLSGHVERAGALLDQAEAFWAHAPRAYPEERLEGLAVRSRLQRAQGDLNGAVASTRQAIQERTALSGHDHRETATLYNSLAITLMGANRLDEALAAYRETTRIYRALGLGESIDAQIILANTGSLEARTGNLREAEALLSGAIERERALAGDSAAVAAAMGSYGQVLTTTHRIPPALATLREATDMAARYAGPNSPVALLNALLLGEAQLAGGDTAAARATLTTAHAAALQHYGPTHILSVRTQLALIRTDLATGPDADAPQQLLALIEQVKALGAQAAGVHALALQTLGTAYLTGHRIPEAVAAFQQAVDLRAQAPVAWELALARERLGEALAVEGSPAAPQLLTRAAQDLETQLGPTHPESLRALVAAAHARAP